MIAKSLAEMHGGEMTVTSEHGQGSTFSFTLPLRAEDVGPRLAPSSGTATPVATPAVTQPPVPVRHSEEDLTDELDLDLIMGRPEPEPAQPEEEAPPAPTRAAGSPTRVLVVERRPGYPPLVGAATRRQRLRGDAGG